MGRGAVRVGYVIPTLGKRNSLINTVNSILSCPDVEKIVIVIPVETAKKWQDIFLGIKKIKIAIQENQGLPEAINQGFTLLSDCDYWNWCGDDDEIIATGISSLGQQLNTSKVSLWGVGSSYVHVSKWKIKRIVRMNKWKFALQDWGPNLVSQPACLFKVKTTKAIGLVDENFLFAFDQKLIKEFRNYSKPIIVSEPTAAYWWHSDTLSSKNRRRSQMESLKLRLDFAGNTFEKMVILLLFPFSTAFIWLLHLGISTLDFVHSQIV